MLSPQRQHALLDGCTALARKVYAGVPISEPWNLHEIKVELLRQNVTISQHVIAGCLRALVDSGLVRELEAQTFIRTPVKNMKEPSMKPKLVTPETQETSSPEPTIFEALAAIAVQLRTLADDIDSVALKVNAASEAENAELQKLRQLQSILKSIA